MFKAFGTIRGKYFEGSVIEIVEDIMKRIYNSINYLFLLGFSCVIGFIIFHESTVLVFFVMCTMIYFCNKMKFKNFTLFLFFGCLLIRIIAIIFLHPAIISDFSIMYEAAHKLMVGDFSFSKSSYFTLWAYQTPFVVWEAFLLSIWDSPIFLELIQALLSSATICLLYRIILSFANESSAQISMLLLMVFPFSFTLVTILTNQIASAFFLILGIWLLVSADTKKLGFSKYAIAGLLFQIGNLLRPEGIIIIVAIFAYFIFSFCNNKNKFLVFGGVTLLIAYFSLGISADYIVRKTNLNENGLQNSFPEWKFVCGLNHETNGNYSSEDWNMLFDTLDENYMPTIETKLMQNELISQRINMSLKELMVFLYKKSDSLWKDSALWWVFGNIQVEWNFLNTELYSIIQQFDRILFFLSLSLSGIGIYKLLKGFSVAHLMYFVIFSSFCAFILIEVQARYAYLPQLFIFATSSLGMDQLHDCYLKIKNIDITKNNLTS